jgi:predicted transcriptional regulator
MRKLGDEIAWPAETSDARIIRVRFVGEKYDMTREFLKAGIVAEINNQLRIIKVISYTSETIEAKVKKKVVKGSI